MISCTEFSQKLIELGYDTATGIPDSTFKGLISYFTHENVFRHIIASNECEAMAIAAGYFLSSKKPAIVYLQNSGFGKVVNPYTSLLSKDIYSLPVLMLIGWRGEPGKKDEPQHKMMGRIFFDLMKVLELPYTLLEEESWKDQLIRCHESILDSEEAHALVIRRGIFEDYSEIPEENEYTLAREWVLEKIVESISPDALFVSTTGKTSRELFEIRERRKDIHGRDFYTVGSMGCTSAIAFGAGLAQDKKKIFILDGDGAVLMQLGTLTTIGHYKNRNLKHILIDNNSHESTGGQPTVSDTVDFKAIGKACGYEFVVTVDDDENLVDAIKGIENNNRLSLLIVKSKRGSRPGLGRPTTTPKENRNAFIKYLGR
jgi:phosphonopyruvate decarboxylase